MSMIQLSESEITEHISRIITEVVTSIVADPNYQEGIRNGLIRELSASLLVELRKKDVDSMIKQEIERYITVTKESAVQSGISDLATANQITVFDHSTVVENELVAQAGKIITDLIVERHLVVNDLTITGNINPSSSAWKALVAQAAGTVSATISEQIASNVSTQLSKSLSNFSVLSEKVLHNGAPLLTNNSINSTVTKSSLQSVGTLDSLAVSGPATLAKTMHVESNRVGINNSEPDMALSIRDHEVTLSLGKHSEQTAYIGTSRLSKLLIGVNRRGAIEIDEDLTVSVSKLRLGGITIVTDNKMPSYSGNKGDLVFNTNPAISGPTGWQCLGGTRWRQI